MTAPKRILVIRTGGVGDFILSLPVVSALATAWPDAELEILGRPEIAVLAASDVTRNTSIDDRRFARLFADTALDASDPAAAYLSSFDIVVSFLGKPESDFGRKLRALVPRTWFIPPPKTPGTKHAVIHFLESLAPLIPGAPSAHNIPRIVLPADDRDKGQQAVERLVGDADRAIVVHPGSGGRRKNWPPALFAQTIRLFEESGYSPILLEGEADEEAIRDTLSQLQGNQVPVLKNATLPQVAGVFTCNRLVIGNDSGISHLAAAVGTPLVCLFGPTDQVVWRPLGAKVQVLTFDEATPDRVYAEARRLMRAK